MTKVVRVQGRAVGAGHPTFLIAEIGTNHNGDLNLALEMVQAAAASGADAVKFQTVCADASYIEGSFAYNVFKKIWLDCEQLARIKQLAEEKGLIFFSSPADLVGAQLLKELGPPAVKISSGSMTNIPLIRSVAEMEVPVFLSTGMAYLGEIEHSVLTLEESGIADIILMHCTSLYPAPDHTLNLRAIQTLQTVFRRPVGFSDHSLGHVAALSAVVLGAVAIEKHFTTDRSLPGPDQSFSADPDEFSTLVRKIRQGEQMLGSGFKRPVQEEIPLRKSGRRCLVATKDIAKGESITEANVGLKRPKAEPGLATDCYYQILGGRAARSIQKDEPIDWTAVRL